MPCLGSRSSGVGAVIESGAIRVRVGGRSCRSGIAGRVLRLGVEFRWAPEGRAVAAGRGAEDGLEVLAQRRGGAETRLVGDPVDG